MKASGRRRGFSSWFVEPHRQVRLGLVFISLNLAFAIIIFSVFGYYFWDVYQSMTTYLGLSTSQGSEMLMKFRLPMMIAGALLLIFVILSFLLSVKYTHEIYGPLVSIHRFLDSLLEGKPVETISLRESDQLQELARKLNAVAGLVQDNRSQAEK